MAMIFGHRGARGEFPENSIEGFLYAASLGIYGLEMDVVISADKKVVVSHEPWMNPKICSKPDDSRISFLRRKNLYRMDYEAIRQYDCGKRGNPDFPKQKKMPAYKPLLREVITTVEDYIKRDNLKPIVYNIEIKSNRRGDNRLHPHPAVFVPLVMDVLLPFGINDRLLIQSFDIRPLKVIHSLYPGIKTGMLVRSPLFIRQRLRTLGFTPETCGIYHRYASRKWVKQIHVWGMKVLTWTGNDLERMKQEIEMGVDGIITDYPEAAINYKL